MKRRQTASEDAQAYLSTFDEHWQHYLLAQQNPQTLAWYGARLLATGTAEGELYLKKAQELGYAQANEMRKVLVNK